MTPAENTLILTEEELRLEIGRFINKLSVYPRSVRREIIQALQWSRNLHANQKRDSGEPYIIHPIRTAEILIDLRMDPTSIKGALLHDVLEDTVVSREDLINRFGKELTDLVDGVTKIDSIHVGGKGAHKAASLRKMVWAMVKDLRVILIKLADKRHNMSTLQHITEKSRRTRIARECLEIYAPMAGRLGMNSLKAELEDLSFKYLKPDFYLRIRDHVAVKQEIRRMNLEEIRNKLLVQAHKARIKVSVDVRAKHYYSIYRKTKDRGKELDEIFDLLGMRIICDSVNACYLMLGEVHRLWAPLEGRFKDYIARPKNNGYQSLHTTVLTKGGHSLEIQIRDKHMHKTAEVGVAAHWAYKERKKSSLPITEEITMRRQLQTLQEAGYDDDAGEFLEAIKRDVLRDSIIVYTPKGEPIELPEGSTAIDFAYHIHSEIGDCCTGAKVDGNILPLTKPLENTQSIQILTSKSAHPHVKWLKHVRSSHARSKIKAWLNRNDSNVLIDRNIVARKKPEKPRVPDQAENKISKDERHVLNQKKIGITIGNERNMMIQISSCCNPSPGDFIIGYISRGRGIIVHKRNCPNLKGIPDFTDRKIYVEWEAEDHRFSQGFQIHAEYTHNLFGKIENAIRKYHGHLISGSIDETDRGEMDGVFTVEMERKEDYKKITQSIRTIPTILTLTENQTDRGSYL